MGDTYMSDELMNDMMSNMMGVVIADPSNINTPPVDVNPTPEELQKAFHDVAMWDDFIDMIHESAVKVVFIKKDGTERTMKCSLVEDAYAGYEFKEQDVPKVKTHDNYQSVWDLDAAGWRSIRKGTIVSVEAL